jgi:hypothetical protein
MKERTHKQKLYLMRDSAPHSTAVLRCNTTNLSMTIGVNKKI